MRVCSHQHLWRRQAAGLLAVLLALLPLLTAADAARAAAPRTTTCAKTRPVCCCCKMHGMGRACCCHKTGRQATLSASCDTPVPQTDAAFSPVGPFVLPPQGVRLALPDARPRVFCRRSQSAACGYSHPGFRPPRVSSSQ